MAVTFKVGDEGGRIRIRGVPRADAAQPQLLDQPVLQRLVRAFHASLGLARVGTECVDIELIQRPAKLGDAFARRLTFSRSISRIVIVIVPVAFIAGSLSGCPADKLPRTRHFLYGRLPFAR